MLKKKLFVATYPEMLDIAKRASQLFGGEMKIVSGELYEAVNKIQPADLVDKELIVSRGGTARLLRDSFRIPVIEIEVSAYDILRAVYKYSNKKIAVVGADNVISGAKGIGEIMGLDIHYYPFTFEDEIEEKVNLMREMNIDVVVGDTVAVRIAQRKGMAVELIKSGKESVEYAIDKGIKICEAILQEREKNSLINAIIEHLNEAIIVTDENSKIILFNNIAEKLFNRSKEEFLEKKCSFNFS